MILHTERLILRKIEESDAEALFAIDSDPEVNRYLGNKPVQTLAEIMEIIQFIQKQYTEHAIGRYAVIERSSGNFIGWSGLKYLKSAINKHVDVYELGYRFHRDSWGKGYATEAAQAWVKYAFDELNVDNLYAMADSQNKASRKVLEKCGMKFNENFDFDGVKRDWFVQEKI